MHPADAGGPPLPDAPERYPYHDPYPHAEPTPRAVPPWPEDVERARVGFYAGLAGGVLVLVAAFITALFLTALATFGGGMPEWPGRADDIGDGWPAIPAFIGLWGLATGGAILLAAIAARERPDRAAVPGIVMIAAGVLSLFALGGFLVGGLLAIAGGVLAIAGSRSPWRDGPGRGYARAGGL